MFAFVGAVLDLVFWLTFVTFVVTGTWFTFISHAKTALRARRGFKFLVAGAVVAVAGLIFPVWIVGAVCAVALPTTVKWLHDVRLPLDNGSARPRLPR